MILLDKVNKMYNSGKTSKVKILDNVSIELSKNGLVALLGKSGSGKTTLLNVLGGIDAFDSGLYKIEGEEYNSKNRLSKIIRYKRRHIGFIFQDFKLIEHISVEENLELALKVSGNKKQEKLIEQVLSDVSMTNFNNRKVSTLSGGQKQRIAIARALIINPKIILADEPTGNLDMHNSMIIMNILKKVAKEKIVFLVSHNEQLVYNFADRIIMIEDGRITSDVINNPSNYPVNKPSEQLQNLIPEVIYCKNNTNINLSTNSSNETTLKLYIENEKVVVISNKKVEITNSYTPHNEQKANIYPVDNKEDSMINQNQSSINSSKKRKRYNDYYKVHFSRLTYFTITMWTIVSLLTSISVSLYAKNSNIDPIEYQYSSPNMVGIISHELRSELINIDDSSNTNYILPYHIVQDYNITLSNSLYQFQNLESYFSISLSVKPLSSSELINDNLLYGRLPMTPFEIALDRRIFEKKNNTEYFLRYGIVDSRSLLNGIIKLHNDLELKIVGIVNTETPTIYMNLGIMYSDSLSSVYGDGAIIPDISATFITNHVSFESSNEVYVSKIRYNQLGFSENKHILLINNDSFIIKGYFETEYSGFEDTIIMSYQGMKDIVFDKISNQQSALVIVNNKAVAMEQNTIYNESNIVYNDELMSEYLSYLRNQENNIIVMNILISVIFSVAIVLFYQTTKLNIISNKDIQSIKILLGINKRQLIAESVLINFIFTIVISIPAYTTVTIILNNIRANPYLNAPIFGFTWNLFFVGLLILILLPPIAVYMSMVLFYRGTPLEMIKKIKSEI